MNSAKLIHRRYFNLISFWLVVSSVYYLNFLLTGDITPDRNQGVLQSSAKLLFPFFIGLLVYIKSIRDLSYHHAAKIAIFSGLFLIFLSLRVFSDVFDIRPGAVFFLELLVINLSLLMMGGVLRVLSQSQLEKICDVILFTGVIVSIFSMYEIFFLSHLYEDYWIQTEGMRSVSSLLNPNNLGVYIGACIVILVSSAKTRLFKILLGALFLFPLLLSGSRTAWVCLFVILIIILIRNSCKNPANLLLMLVVFVFLISIYIWLDSIVDAIGLFGYDLSSRISDGRSSAIRIDKYMEFLLNFNENYLFPDFENRNIFLVSESSYFTFVNYFGIFGCVLFIAFASLFYKITLVECFKSGPWIYVFVYYIFVGFFESIITSFPNNQLFMISAGSFLVFRGASGKKVKSSILNYENDKCLQSVH